MLFLMYSYLFVVFLGLLVTVSGSDEIIESYFNLFHSLNGEFSLRSRIQLITGKDGHNQFVFLDNNKISQVELSFFKDLLDSNSFYQIKIQSVTGNYTSPMVLSSIPACELQKSGFKEDLQLFLDNSKNITGISYTTPAMAIARKCDPSKIKDAVTFQTRIKLGEITTAQKLPIQPLGPKPMYLNDVKLGGIDEAGAKPPPQSFLQKYWYIVAVLIIYMMIGGKADEPAAAESKKK